MGPDFDGHEPWHHHHGGPGLAFFPLLGALPLLLTLLVTLWVSGYGAALVAWLRAAFAPDPWRARWAEAVDRHHAVAADFAAFECDPRSILDRPALSDVRQPATGRFVEAFAEARALLTERYPAQEFARRFGGAVEREEQAWAAAVEAAQRLVSIPA
jgi:hypothetical protein